MSRKNIFEIISQNTDIGVETNRIINLFEFKILCWYQYKGYSLLHFVNFHCFEKWKKRGHCIDAFDFLNSANYDEIKNTSKFCSVQHFLTLIELVYNFWYIAFLSKRESKALVEVMPDFYLLQNIMDDCLQQFNYKAIMNPQQQCVIIAEDKPEVTAVAEIVEEKLAIELIRYNHHSLKGDINKKKIILRSFGDELEGYKKELSSLNNQLGKDIFFMLNNLNIRHNNLKENDKNYQEYTAKMDEIELEKWYDELYQMMLLARLMLDNVQRTNDVKELKGKY